MAARLKEKYLKELKPALQKELGLDNPMAVPRLEKIVVNMGLGEATQNVKMLDPLVNDLALIAGQKPVLTRTKKAISNFKLKENQIVGCTVTLRGNAMWEFLYRLLAVSLPSIRDFRGVGTKLDGHGNYSLGITDFTIFPEITVENIKKSMGLDITIVTSARTDDEGRELLRTLGMPFRRAETVAPKPHAA